MLTRWYQTTPPSRVDWPISRASLFDEVFDNFFGPAWTASAGPRFEHWEEDGAIVLSADVPGLTKDDLTVSVDKGVLTIAGERKLDVPEGFEARRRERGGLRFNRSIRLDSRFDVANAEAEVRDGVLTVRLPLQPEAQPRQIPIKVG